RPDCPHRSLGDAVVQAGEELDAQGLQGGSAWPVHHLEGPCERRPGGIPQVPGEAGGHRKSMMPDYTYLIVGGGMTGDAAAHGIREVDRSGSIGMIGDEAHPPYDRPPLTKGLWKGKPLESIWREK